MTVVSTRSKQSVPADAGTRGSGVAGSFVRMSLTRMIDRCKWILEPFCLHNFFLYFLGKRLFHLVPALLPHERDYHALKKLLRGPSGLFVDVGANDGVSALSFRAVTKGLGDFTILSIEPNPAHARVLQRIQRGDPAFSFRTIALGDRRAELSLHVPVFFGLHMSSAATLSADHRTLFESALSGFFRRGLRYREYRIQVIPLDDLGLKPLFMKIDAEGFDDKVLRGAERTIRAYQPILMCEYNVNNIAATTAILRGHGYSLFRYLPAGDRFVTYGGEACRNFFALPGSLALTIETEQHRGDTPPH